MATKFHPVVDDVIDGYDKRPWKRAPSLIVVHHTGTNGKKLSLLDKAKRKLMHSSIAKYLGARDKIYVSAHFQIGYDGEITQIVNPKTHVAYHAGKSSWYDAATKKVLNNCNDFSVGIELLGDGNQYPYSEAQISRLQALINSLVAEIPSLAPNRVVGHQHVSPGRKVDPGMYFPWQDLAKRLQVTFNHKNKGLPV